MVPVFGGWVNSCSIRRLVFLPRRVYWVGGFVKDKLPSKAPGLLSAYIRGVVFSDEFLPLHARLHFGWLLEDGPCALCGLRSASQRHDLIP